MYIYICMYLGKQSICIVYFSYTITYYHIINILWVTSMGQKFTSFSFIVLHLHTAMMDLTLGPSWWQYYINAVSENTHWMWDITPLWTRISACFLYYSKLSLLLLMTRRYLMKTAQMLITLFIYYVMDLWTLRLADHNN